MYKIENNYLLSIIKTFYFFIIFLLALPLIIFNYFFLNILRKFIYKLLEKVYPDLEFVYNSNLTCNLARSKTPAMYHAVMKVMGKFNKIFILNKLKLIIIIGKCDIDVIRREVLERVVDAKDSNGFTLYPKMKMQLTTCCYHYAWKKITKYV